uniref:Uncharacterized protein n=1 Tax=Parascaris univalens TaxID=6257 RepID=A0A915BI08_PARUN
EVKFFKIFSYFQRSCGELRCSEIYYSDFCKGYLQTLMKKLYSVVVSDSLVPHTSSWADMGYYRRKKTSDRVVTNGKEDESDILLLNIDAVLQIGSVMERIGIEQKRQESFDWLAQNREKIKTDEKEVAKHLQIAIGDLPMSRELIKKSLEVLIKKGKLSTDRYNKEFKIFEAAPDDQLPTVAQMAALLREYGVYSKAHTK